MATTTQTARDVVAAALRLLNEYAPGEPIEAADEADALEALNDMLHAWTVKLQYTHAALTANDALTLDDRHIKGVKAMLAVEIAPQYGKSASEKVHRDADMGWRAVLADPTIGLDVNDVVFDNAINFMSSSRYYGLLTSAGDG